MNHEIFLNDHPIQIDFDFLVLCQNQWLFSRLHKLNDSKRLQIDTLLTHANTKKKTLMTVLEPNRGKWPVFTYLTTGCSFIIERALSSLELLH